MDDILNNNTPPNAGGTPPLTPNGNDTPTPATPDIDTEAEDAAHREKMAALFGDLDDEDEPTDEAMKALKEERDTLRQQAAETGMKLLDAKKEILDLKKQMADQARDAAASLARTIRQAEEQKGFALEKFIMTALPVMDNMERALEVLSKNPAGDPKSDGLQKGVGLTLKQLKDIFNKAGLKEINPEGEAFDSNKHEAIDMHEDPSVEEPTVSKVVLKGYELNGKIIRHAKVIVIQP